MSGCCGDGYKPTGEPARVTAPDDNILRKAHRRAIREYGRDHPRFQQILQGIIDNMVGG